MANGESRIFNRFFGDTTAVEEATSELNNPIDAETAEDLGLVTHALDDIDYEDEVNY